jgi:hypothetical protein
VVLSAPPAFTLSNGNLYNNTGTQPELIDSGVKQFTVVNNQVFDLHTNGNVELLNPDGSGKSQVASNMTSLVSDASGNVFALDYGSGVVWEYVPGSGTNWTIIGTNGTALVGDATGNVFLLNSAGYVYEHVPNSGWNWTIIGTNGTALVGDATGNVFLLNSAGYVCEYVLGSGGNSNVVSSSGLSDLVSDATGNVFALGYGSGVVWEHVLGSGGNWNVISSSGLSDLVSDATGNVFALSYGSGVVWEHVLGAGADWNPIPATGVTALVSDATGDLIMLNTLGLVYDRSASGSSNIIGSGVVAIAIAADGNVRMENSHGTWYEETTPGQWVFGVDHPDPGNGVGYSAVTGALFGPGGPSYMDVQQGVLGDCWLLASLAETAYRAPADITGMFTYDGTAFENGAQVGVYTVRFYNSGGTAKYVTVDTELPDDRDLFASVGNGVLWVALAEKAYAEANAAGYVTTDVDGRDAYYALGGFTPPEFGGSPSWALQAITGKSVSSASYNPNDLVSAWNSGQLVVLGTPPLAANATAPLVLNGPAGPRNIVSSHEYAVVGYNASNQAFTLFNPWGVNGQSEPLPNGTSAFCPGTACGTAQQIASVFSEFFGVGGAGQDTQGVGAQAIPPIAPQLNAEWINGWATDPPAHAPAPFGTPATPTANGSIVEVSPAPDSPPTFLQLGAVDTDAQRVPHLMLYGLEPAIEGADGQLWVIDTNRR